MNKIFSFLFHSLTFFFFFFSFSLLFQLFFFYYFPSRSLLSACVSHMTKVVSINTSNGKKLKYLICLLCCVHKHIHTESEWFEVHKTLPRSHFLSTLQLFLSSWQSIYFTISRVCVCVYATQIYVWKLLSLPKRFCSHVIMYFVSIYLLFVRFIFYVGH